MVKQLNINCHCFPWIQHSTFREELLVSSSIILYLTDQENIDNHGFIVYNRFLGVANPSKPQSEHTSCVNRKLYVTQSINSMWTVKLSVCVCVCVARSVPFGPCTRLEHCVGHAEFLSTDIHIPKCICFFGQCELCSSMTRDSLLLGAGNNVTFGPHYKTTYILKFKCKRTVHYAPACNSKKTAC